MAGEASERAAGSQERPQGRSARQQCREESLGLGGAKSPAHPRVQEANKPPRSSSTIRQLFFLCVFGVFLFVFFFFFFFSNISKEESKGKCVFFLKSFSVVVLEGFVGRGFFYVIFSKGKGREKLLQQSPVFARDGHSWGSGCTVHTGSSPGACQPPNQPSSQEGVTTSLSSAKVLWLTSKLSVTEGRGGQRESQTLGKVKTLGRREQENEEGDAPGRRRRWREAPAHGEGTGGASRVRRSEAPQQHRHTLWLRSPTGGKPRSSELPERLPRHPSQGDTQGTRWGHTEQTCFGKSRRTSSNNLKLDIYI